MLRRGNRSEGVLDYLMRGSLSERLLFLSSFIPTDHMAHLYMTKEPYTFVQNPNPEDAARAPGSGLGLALASRGIRRLVLENSPRNVVENPNILEHLLSFFPPSLSVMRV